MTPDLRRKTRAPLSGFALEHNVDEALHQLQPGDEQLLRRRYHLGAAPRPTRLSHRKHPPREVAALRALRRLGITADRRR